MSKASPIKATITWNFKFIWMRNFSLFLQRYINSLLTIVIEPVFVYLAFAYGLGQYVQPFSVGSYAEFLIPGFAIITTMTVAFLEGSISTEEKLNERDHYLNFHHIPVTWSEVAIGEISWGASKGFLAGFIISILAYNQAFLSLQSLVFMALALIITGVTFSSLGLFVMAVSSKKDYLPYAQALIILPMYLLSGAFFPFQELPTFYHQTSLFFPVTHAIEFVRSMLSGIWDLQVYIHLGIMLSFMAVMIPLAIKKFEQRFYK